jgi:Flp pilus assembly protein TadB
MAKKRYTKLEEEIIQILDAKEQEPAWRKVSLRRFRPRLPRRQPRRPGLDDRPGKANGLIWLGATFGLALIAIMVASYSHALALVLALICILVFLSPIVLSRRTDPIYRSSRQWRGRDLDFPPPRDGLSGEIKYRLWQIRNRDSGRR